MKACVFTLGCKQNEAESASLMRGLAERGFEVTDRLGYADVYIVNTCAVTAEAEKKSRQSVARMRKFNPAAPVIVCGCASEHDAEAFARRAGVVFVTGTMRKERVIGAAEEALRSLAAETVCCRETETEFAELPLPMQTRTRAYLRVQDGCDRFCSYCLIPYLRGRSRSRRAEKVLEEAKALPAREIVLTGIDLGDYHDGDTDLGGLLWKLKEIPARIRLGSLEVGVITEAFLEKMKGAGNVVPHFHLSLQSGSDAVLKAMNRKYTRAEYLAACRMIYGTFPDAAVTTDIIVGFPTETEEDFQQSLSIVREAGLARVHAFPFSPREGTNAFRMPDLPASVKKERMERMLACAETAEADYIAKFLGKEGVALFESDGGYTENYLRVYAENAREGGLYRVRLLEREKDGVRAEILEEISMENCIFCKILKGEIPSSKVYEDDEIVIFKDIHPLAKIHLLCVPKEHFAYLSELNEVREKVVGRALGKIASLAPQLGLQDGYRLVVNQGESAGQTVRHLHIHILGGEPLGWE